MVRRPPLPTAPASASARERLATAALHKFAEHGFDTTTVDEIADAAGVSRRTFFRHFPTKEDAIFPDHDGLRAAVAGQLDARQDESPLTSVCNAVRLVLADYVRQKDVSLHRFALTRQVSALREREVGSVHAYQRMFVRYLRDRLPDHDELQAELMAASVVAAHNAVLRHWLRSGGDADAFAELDLALAAVQRLFAPAPDVGDARMKRSDIDTMVAVFRSDVPLRQVISTIEQMTGPAPVRDHGPGRTRRPVRPAR